MADITYIRLAHEWVNLAVILDTYSRLCVGWGLERTPDGSQNLNTLDSALASKSVPEGLVHHSDRGVQCTSKDYVFSLCKTSIRFSMSRRGNPYYNAKAERFIRILKYEKAYLYECKSFEEARSRIDCFIDKLYNRRCLYSALIYRPPTEFEQTMTSAKTMA